jgi:hypothetical protein
MDICARVDDIVWGQSDQVWNETFVLIMRETLGVSSVLNEVMRLILSRISEYEAKYLKVSSISKTLNNNEGVKRLVLHYRDIAMRYTLAYDSCRTVDFAL